MYGDDKRNEPSFQSGGIMIDECPFCGGEKLTVEYSYDDDMEIEMFRCLNPDCIFEVCIGERDISHLMPRGEE